ncbi:hypothetical protein CBR_g39122 [Chara braunii]|uniref:Integrase catalytic domain-containing protein n=1 Tax=Chara braunii TaxID=69332 RepID=A0A388LR02_CHABU|nr:hypothetical protein CBR_g39122 [Chara braunii]|eukprot:GBG84744.1 hypothetical protein CBR_g39122 [Chara braunii]
MARLHVPKFNIFHFNGDRVSEWLELLEQVTCEASEADKFKLMPRYIWWKLRPEVMKVAAGANGEWAKLKEEMQWRLKLGDGMLTKEDLEMLRRDEFSTVRAFATAFEKMAKKVPGLAEEVPPSRAERAALAARTRSKEALDSSQPTKDNPGPSGEKETVDIPEDEEDEDERLKTEEDKKAEERAKKRDAKVGAGKEQEGKRRKYRVKLEEGFDVEGMVDRLLKGHNDLLNLKDILASAPKLRDELKARLSRRLVASVCLGTVIPKEGEWAETGTKMDWKSVACGCVEVMVKLKLCTAMVDTGAEMNLIKEEHALRLGMEIDRSDNGVLMGANSRSVFIGTASSVVLKIDKVKVRSCFFVMPDLDHPILLGRSFFSRTETVILNKHDGTMFLVLCDSVEGHERSIGGIYLLTNALLQDEVARIGDQRQGENENVIHEGEDDDLEKGEIKEVFRMEEYDGIYLELIMLLSCEMRERDACEKVLKMRSNFLVRNDHLFITSKGKRPKRVVCGVNHQIDVMAALHDGTAGGHRSADATYLKIHDLYYWDGMGHMIEKYCKSCVPCQERSSLRPREPLYPRYVREVGAVVHLDLLAMPLGVGEYNFIFDARDNLSGFVDGRAIRTKTVETLARCIEEYYLRYPFVSGFVMDRGSEFTCAEVKKLLRGYGVIAKYTTAAHPQANAPMERGHSTIMNLLAKWTCGRPNQWPNFLRVAFFVDNITVRRSTNYAPATLWYDRHATFPIESFLKTWRRQDLETNLSFEKLLDLRARQINAIEDKTESAASKVADCRQRDKFRWDKMARDNFDKLFEATGRPREQHQEMGVKLVSTDLLSLKGLMKEGFAAAKTSDEKMEKRLTRVARAFHEQRMDWQKEIGDLKKELERQNKEVEAMKIEMEKVWSGNEAIRQVNQTLNKVNDNLRAYLQIQQNTFQVKEAKWEKRIMDLEAKCAQQAPTAVVDWTEV